ncbi:MAG: hypothetical protein M1383_02270 [Patescibacteria group bacterium]|nr:hypothetical protein [Patescibacteria group bacterium]
MKSLKKIVSGLSVLALLALASFGVFSPAKAQTTESATTQAAEQEAAETVQNQGTLGGAYNNPISQWIVLSGLFNPIAFGYPMGGAVGAGGAAGAGGYGYGGAMYNPVSQWIVLSGLFNPLGTFGAAQTTATTAVDP